MFVDELSEAVGRVRSILLEADPGSVSCDEARAVVDLFAQAQKAGAAGVTLFAPRVVDSGCFTKAGHGSAAEWLGSVSGSSPNSAKSILQTAAQVAAMPALGEVLREGELSQVQLRMLADAIIQVPDSQEAMLALAGIAGHAELRDEAARLKAAARSAESERVSRARVHRLRHLRCHQDEHGGIRGEFLCDEAVWARVAPLIEQRAEQRWRTSPKGVPEEPMEAHRLDAFLEILGRSGGGGEGRTDGARPHVLVLIELKALQRGSTNSGETCEIDGVGPVSVAAATQLLGDGLFQLLVRDGVDIRTVTSRHRTIPQRLESALVARDRVCATPGCGARHGLQIDHWQTDFGWSGPTELANLVRLCGPHHNLKTHGGWRLEGGPGRWKWVAPPDPPDAGRIARRKRVAVAKGLASRPLRS